MQKYGIGSLSRHHLHRNLCAKIPHENEIGEGEVGVVEEMMERGDEVQVFGELWIEPFVPVGWRTGQSNEVVKGFEKAAGEPQFRE